MRRTSRSASSGTVPAARLEEDGGRSPPRHRVAEGPLGVAHVVARDPAGAEGLRGARHHGAEPLLARHRRSVGLALRARDGEDGERGLRARRPGRHEGALVVEVEAGRRSVAVPDRLQESPLGRLELDRVAVDVDPLGVPAVVPGGAVGVEHREDEEGEAREELLAWPARSRVATRWERRSTRAQVAVGSSPCIWDQRRTFSGPVPAARTRMGRPSAEAPRSAILTSPPLRDTRLSRSATSASGAYEPDGGETRAAVQAAESASGDGAGTAGGVATTAERAAARRSDGRHSRKVPANRPGGVRSVLTPPRQVASCPCP